MWLWRIRASRSVDSQPCRNFCICLNPQGPEGQGRWQNKRSHLAILPPRSIRRLLIVRRTKTKFWAWHSEPLLIWLLLTFAISPLLAPLLAFCTPASLHSTFPLSPAGNTSGTNSYACSKTQVKFLPPNSYPTLLVLISPKLNSFSSAFIAHFTSLVTALTRVIVIDLTKYTRLGPNLSHLCSLEAQHRAWHTKGA